MKSRTRYDPSPLPPPAQQPPLLIYPAETHSQGSARALIKIARPFFKEQRSTNRLAPALVLSIILAMVIALFTALSFLELTRFQPAGRVEVPFGRGHQDRGLPRPRLCRFCRRDAGHGERFADFDTGCFTDDFRHGQGGRSARFPRSTAPEIPYPQYPVRIAGAGCALIAPFFEVTAVVAIGTFSTLFNDSLANASALKLDFKRRTYPRFFPVLGLLLCLFLMLFAEAHSLAAGMICLTLGLVCYL
jgi:hypothetical protein